MIALISEQDKAQLKEHALKLIEQDEFEGLAILVEVLKETDFEIKDKEACLMWAAENDYLDVLKYLVERGADIHTQYDYALRWAAGKRHLDVVKYLVENGANIHANNNYALRAAEKYGHTEIFGYLQEVLKNDRTHQ